MGAYDASREVYILYVVARIDYQAPEQTENIESVIIQHTRVQITLLYLRSRTFIIVVLVFKHIII